MGLVYPSPSSPRNWRGRQRDSLLRGAAQSAQHISSPNSGRLLKRAGRAAGFSRSHCSTPPSPGCAFQHYAVPYFRNPAPAAADQSRPIRQLHLSTKTSPLADAGAFGEDPEFPPRRLSTGGKNTVAAVVERDVDGLLFFRDVEDLPEGLVAFGDPPGCGSPPAESREPWPPSWLVRNS